MRAGLFALTCLAPALAGAAPGPVRITAELDYSHHMRGGDLAGVGGVVYVGRVVGARVVLEGQLGLHHNWDRGELGTITTRLDITSIPIMLGGRYLWDFGELLVPYVGAHAGVTVVRSSGSVGNLSSDPQVAVDFSFNVGAGVDVAAGETWAFGFGVWYWMVLAGETETVAGVDITKQHDSLVNLALSLRFDL